jgi:hypothetical protein
MRTYARISDGVVAELVQTDQDIGEMYHPALNFIEATGTGAAVGWLWSGTGFTPPAPRQPTLAAPTLADLDAALAALTRQVAALRAQG